MAAVRCRMRSSCCPEGPSAGRSCRLWLGHAKIWEAQSGNLCGEPVGHRLPAVGVASAASPPSSYSSTSRSPRAPRASAPTRICSATASARGYWSSAPPDRTAAPNASRSRWCCHRASAGSPARCRARARSRRGPRTPPTREGSRGARGGRRAPWPPRACLCEARARFARRRRCS